MHFVQGVDKHNSVGNWKVQKLLVTIMSNFDKRSRKDKGSRNLVSLSSEQTFHNFLFKMNSRAFNFVRSFNGCMFVQIHSFLAMKKVVSSLLLQL